MPLREVETAKKPIEKPMSDPDVKMSSATSLQASETEGQATPDFAEIVTNAQQQSAQRVEELRRRAHAIAREQQRRWDEGTVLLNEEVRPLVERALQACVEEGVPAILEDNFGEKAATPRLMFHCSAPTREVDGRPVLGPVSIKMVIESDGKSVWAGTTNSFSTFADDMRKCDNVDETVTSLFSAVLESYFQSCERAQAGDF